MDRESIPSYKLTVIANDNGAPPLNSTAEVYITVEDINDNAPMFSHADRYVVFVKEEQPVGGFVVKLLADDPDSGDNGTVDYSITRGKKSVWKKKKKPFFEMCDELLPGVLFFSCSMSFFIGVYQVFIKCSIGDHIYMYCLVIS